MKKSLITIFAVAVTIIAMAAGTKVWVYSHSGNHLSIDIADFDSLSFVEPGLLEISPIEKKIGNEGGRFTLDITANKPWTASSNDPAVILGTTQGTGNAKIACTAMPNTEEEPYTAIITVRLEDGTYKQTLITVGNTVVRIDPLADARKQCFFEDVQAGTITFVFDSTQWKARNAKKVEVRGSFNNWKETEGYLLTKCDTAKVLPYWFLTVPYEKIKLPGNSGQPEYKFVVDGTWKNAPSWLPAGYKFEGNDVNQIIVFSTDDIEEIKAKSAVAAQKKKLIDFDLTTEQGKQDISNVRVVPGTTKLIRCYHPFKYTDKNRNNTEFKRVDLVKEFFETYGIKSDICLSENEEKNLVTRTFDGETRKESISPYYQEIIDNGAVLYVGVKTGAGTPSYEVCYSDPAGETVGKWIGEIIDFITSDATSAPYGIHCRLGTDRTGFFCAIIAALCGASYSDIMADYQRSNNMGIMEYRDAKKMKYTLEKMLDVEDLSQVSDLKAAVSNFYINNGYLKQEKIDKLTEKLTMN